MIDNKIAAFLTPTDYANLKQTSKGFSGPIHLLKYRRLWAAKAYNTVVYPVQSLLPPLNLEPLKPDSIAADASMNCFKTIASALSYIWVCQLFVDNECYPVRLYSRCKDKRKL